MWLSLLNHVVDKHDGHDGPFSECLHQPLSDRAWLTEGTPAYNKLRSIVSSPRLLKDIRHLSPGSQTSSVEAFNSVLIGNSPPSLGHLRQKEWKRGPWLLHCTTMKTLGGSRPQPGKEYGASWSSRPEHGRAIPQHGQSQATQKQYRDELMDEVMTCLEKWTTLREALEANASQHLPPMCARYPRPPKSDLIASRRSRFSSHAGSSQDQS
ncbi:unnamed protein product [Ixodes persulcatus]